jgi:hypothetical protein
VTDRQGDPKGPEQNLEAQVAKLMADPRFIRELQDEHLVRMLANYAAEPRDLPPEARPTLAGLGNEAMKDPAFLAQFRDYARALAGVWIGLEAEAKQVIGALGCKATPAAVGAYRRFFLLPDSLVSPDLDEVSRALYEDIDEIREQPAEHSNLIGLLPALGEPSSSNADAKKIMLAKGEYEEWVIGLLNLVAVRLIDRKALLVRDRYLRLCNVERFPSKRVFEEELADRVKQLQGLTKGEDAPALDRYVGESAAEAAERARNKYKVLLEEADSVLRPRGSYLNPRTMPKQLRIRKEVAHLLRLKLGKHGSELARSRAIVAALTLFSGGMVLLSWGGASVAAVNIVQRERNRLPEGLADEVNRRLSEARRRRKWTEGLE